MRVTMKCKFIILRNQRRENGKISEMPLRKTDFMNSKTWKMKTSGV